MRSRARFGYDSLSLNSLELFGMAWTAYVMILIREELFEREGEAVVLRGNNASAVRWVLNYKKDKDDVRTVGLMRPLGAPEVKGKLCF